MSLRRLLSLSSVVLFVVVTGAHLAAQLASARVAAEVTQVALMPLLAGALALATTPPRSPLVRLGLVALGFSWLGDAAPRLLEGRTAFLAMVGFFLIAQIVYAIAFAPLRERSVLLRGRVWVAVYLGFAAAMVAVCAPKAGALLPVIAVYALAIVTMAVLATGLGWRGASGGAVFVVSDGLIAARAFAGLELPAHGAWVMLTYALAQALLIAAIVHDSRAPTHAPATARASMVSGPPSR